MNNNSARFWQCCGVDFPERNETSLGDTPGAMLGGFTHVNQYRTALFKPLANGSWINGLYGHRAPELLHCTLPRASAQDIAPDQFASRRAGTR